MARWAPQRRDVLEATADELLHNYGRGRVMVAVDGPSGAGKTTFADDLAEALRKKGHDAFRASIDDFLNPRATRYAQGRDSAKGRYDDAYNYSVFRRVLAEPFRMNGSTGFVLAAFDEDRDADIESRWVTGPADAILLVDGSYLLRPELRGIWNTSIWLDADAAVRDDRLLERDGIEPASERSQRYAGAYKLYKKTKPRDSAAIIVDNTDPEHPRRIFTDSC
ncbi:uridine kinase [soil metagenome]